MSTETVTPNLQPDAGVVMEGANIPRGLRAAQIRYLHDKYPELSNSAIARRVGCDEGNVRQVLRRYLREIPISDIEDFRNDKGTIFEVLQHRTLSSITDDDIAKTPFIQRVTAAAILQDKIQLLRGQPTAIHAHILVDVLDALRHREDQW